VDINKLSTGLAFRLQSADGGDLVDVIVELEAPPSKPSNVAASMAKFKESSAPVTGSIEQMGGQVLGFAWINSTVRARVPARAVCKLAAMRNVERIDVPHALKAEAR
jgi:hypothetical protein